MNREPCGVLYKRVLERNCLGSSRITTRIVFRVGVRAGVAILKANTQTVRRRVASSAVYARDQYALPG